MRTRHLLLLIAFLWTLAGVGVWIVRATRTPSPAPSVEMAVWRTPPQAPEHLQGRWVFVHYRVNGPEYAVFEVLRGTNWTEFARIGANGQRR